MASSAPSRRLALLLLASTFATPAAWAHAHLTHQYPAANAAVTASPQALTLNFSEGIEPGFRRNHYWPSARVHQNAPGKAK